MYKEGRAEHERIMQEVEQLKGLSECLQEDIGLKREAVSAYNAELDALQQVGEVLQDDVATKRSEVAQLDELRTSKQQELQELRNLKQLKADLEQRSMQRVSRDLLDGVETIMQMPAKRRILYAKNIHAYEQALPPTAYNHLCSELLKDSDPYILAEMARQGFAPVLAAEPSALVKQACEEYWAKHQAGLNAIQRRIEHKTYDDDGPGDNR